MGLSDFIIDAIANKVQTQTLMDAGSIFKEPRHSSSVTVSPYATVFTDGPWGVEELRYRQIRRTVPVVGLIVYSIDIGLTLPGTLALVRNFLDSIEIAILNDSTLGGIVDRAVPNLMAPEVFPNSKLVFGPFSVACVSTSRLIGAP